MHCASRCLAHARMVNVRSKHEGGAPKSPGWYPDTELPDALQYWDGDRWTGQRSSRIPIVKSPSRRVIDTIGWVVASAVLLVGALALFLIAQNSEAIARVKGTVVTVAPAEDDQVEVCLGDVVDAGSTYGNTDDRSSLCWSGELEGSEPTIGACVVLQSEGEASYLRVERSEGCR